MDMNAAERLKLLRIVTRAIVYYKTHGHKLHYAKPHLFWLAEQIKVNVVADKSDAATLICRNFVLHEYMRRMGSEPQHRQSLRHWLKLSDYDYNNDTNTCLTALSLVLRGPTPLSTELLGGVCKRLATVCMET